MYSARSAIVHGGPVKKLDELAATRDAAIKAMEVKKLANKRFLGLFKRRRRPDAKVHMVRALWIEGAIRSLGEPVIIP